MFVGVSSDCVWLSLPKPYHSIFNYCIDEQQQVLLMPETPAGGETQCFEPKVIKYWPWDREERYKQEVRALTKLQGVENIVQLEKIGYIFVNKKKRVAVQLAYNPDTIDASKFRPETFEDLKLFARGLLMVIINHITPVLSDMSLMDNAARGN